MRGPFTKQENDWRGDQHESERDLGPGGAPAADSDSSANGGERRREEQAEQHRVDAHCHPHTTVERFAHGGDAGDRQRALSQGAAGSFMFADRGPRMLQAYTGGAEVKSRVDIFVKDMGIVTSVGRTSHVPLPLAAAAEQLYLIAEAAGLGAQDDSSVVTILSPPSGDGPPS